jgi:hypothetical protein
LKANLPIIIKVPHLVISKCTPFACQIIDCKIMYVMSWLVWSPIKLYGLQLAELGKYTLCAHMLCNWIFWMNVIINLGWIIVKTIGLECLAPWVYRFGCTIEFISLIQNHVVDTLTMILSLQCWWKLWHCE